MPSTSRATKVEVTTGAKRTSRVVSREFVETLKRVGASAEVIKTVTASTAPQPREDRDKTDVN